MTEPQTEPEFGEQEFTMCPDGAQLGDYNAHMAAMEAWLEREAEAG